MANLKGKNVILAVCGGIAVYKVCDLVRKLISLDAAVFCVMTENAKKFVTPLTFQTLSNNKVYHDMFDTSSWDIEHVSLAQKADIVVVVPATANTIAKLAHGFADNLVCATVLATKSKVIVCPAMNTNMFEHQATQKNIMTLKDYGYKFVEPKTGKLACGIIGNGNLASVETIAETIIEEIA
jgi:phosphopantothenoylcysteine decarboxylase/phosphopantothenate--cysteine ligase